MQNPLALTWLGILRTMGRQPPGARRTAQVCTTVTIREKVAMQAHAAEAGLPLSEWMRQKLGTATILDGLIPDDPAPHPAATRRAAPPSE
jgi:hypothetical protein